MTLPLVVDLDETLLRSDLLVETGMAFIHRHPFQLYKTVGWLAQGKTVLKSQLASILGTDNAFYQKFTKLYIQADKSIIRFTASDKTVCIQLHR